MNALWQRLDAAQSIIADGTHWCQGEYAYDERGCKVSPHSPEAHSFCALGAYKKAGGGPCDQGEEALENAARELFNSYVADVNDGLGLGLEDVMRVYERAKEIVS